jgi:hypothetical protein
MMAAVRMKMMSSLITETKLEEEEAERDSNVEA